MEAFSISCTTCGRRLRVRDPGLIGQILACPKCGGMVLIAPPMESGADAGAAPADPAPESPDTAARAGSAGPNSKGRNSKGPNSQAADSQAADSQGADVQLALGDSAVDSEAVTREGIETRLPPPRSGAAGDPWETSRPGASAGWDRAETESVDESLGLDRGALEGPVQWQSDSSARARQIGGIALLAIASLLISAGIFWYMVRQWQATRLAAADPETSAEVNNTADEPDPQSSSAGEVPAADAVANSAADVSEPDTSADELVPAAEAGEADADADASGGAAESPSGVSDAEGASETEAEIEAEGASEATEPLADDAGSRVGESPGESPAVVPPAPNLFPGPTDAASAETADEVPSIDELPAGLQQYMPLIELANAGDVPVENPLPPPPTVEDLRVAAPETAIPESEYPPAADPVNVRMRMKSRVLGIEVRERPFDQVVRVLGQVGGIPIELDLPALDVAGIAPDTPINLRLVEQEAAVVLSRAVDAAGCRMTLGDDGIVRVGPAVEALQAGLQQALSLDDFEGRLPIDPEALQRMIGEGDEGLKVAAEPTAGAWSIEGSVESRIRAALVMEGLRKARGLAPRLAAERTSRWVFEVAEDGAAVDWKPIPEEPVTLDFDRPKAVDMIIGEVARERGAAAVLDWDSAWSHGLTAEATALPWLRNRTAAEVLKEVLEPYGLEAFVAGEGVWWVGTRDAYERSEVIAVISLPQDRDEQVDGDELLRRVAFAAGQATTEAVPALLDAESGKLVVRLPRYIVRELPAVLADRELALIKR